MSIQPLLHTIERANALIPGEQAKIQEIKNRYPGVIEGNQRALKHFKKIFKARGQKFSHEQARIAAVVKGAIQNIQKAKAEKAQAENELAALLRNQEAERAERAVMLLLQREEAAEAAREVPPVEIDEYADQPDDEAYEVLGALGVYNFAQCGTYLRSLGIAFEGNPIVKMNEVLEEKGLATRADLENAGITPKQGEIKSAEEIQAALLNRLK